MKPQDNFSLAWVTGGMNGLSYMESSVVFVYIGCTEHHPLVHCNATPLEVPVGSLGDVPHHKQRTCSPQYIQCVR